jgi:hypothetical protein
MPRLCFRHQETARLIAEVESEQAVVIPVAEDRIYAPSADNPGVYAQFRIAGREFFFDQQGALALINLECVELSPPAVAPLAPQAPGSPLAARPCAQGVPDGWVARW